MTNNQRGMGLVQVIWIAAGVLAIMAAAWHMVGNMRNPSKSTTCSSKEARNCTNQIACT
jgi:hypothetical protein